MGIKKCHGKFCIFTNARCAAQETACRVESYNRVVDAIQEASSSLVVGLKSDSSVKINSIELDGQNYSSWNIYEEMSSNNYWIDLTTKGILIEGTNHSNEPRTAQRLVLIRHITTKDDVAQLDCCYSGDGLLDFCTILKLCDRILYFCTELGLCDHLMTAEELAAGLPSEAIDSLRQQQLSFGNV